MTVRKKKAKEKIYGNNIREILEEKEMVQQELADLIDTNPAHLSRIINGKRLCISLPVAMKIAEALDRPVEEVFILNEPDGEDEDDT
jgi:transcriptional regulator with XRE-family HTH domain